ncbi:MULTISPECIES: ABC-three component system protein [unclassified Achromobacter]|uniref:ABC-three component system protein n=1 Tax=unclassified Achromobacter TaxID=2626865 RepID=UPI000B51B2DF|nr:MULTISPECIES: ABC-three component system protein [unclassified Achromobacter]OWT72954.1 hypothetical protein CEY05_24055 [Achromobacter sp. HZ34]OWT74172.1 hypothetical protein CEY04_22890 [Achromobacter sp. HZ28]
MTTKSQLAQRLELDCLPAPTPWPGANARLLGHGLGLPIKPLDRLAGFSPDEFERFTLEWACDFLAKQDDIYEVQARGGAGDKGRDVIVWLDAPGIAPRRSRFYQCKRWQDKLGLGSAGVEIAKLLFYTHRGDYPIPLSYHFVTHKGVTGPLQDLLDDGKKLRNEIIATWDDYKTKVRKDPPIELTGEFLDYVNNFDFKIFHAKQPHELIEEHSKTRFHLTVFGLPLIERAPPPSPPSTAAASESKYIQCLYNAIAFDLKRTIIKEADFDEHSSHQRLFKRSRLTFYSAEGLRELARDNMSNSQYFDTLLEEFSGGLYHWYADPTGSPLGRLHQTVKGAQSLALAAHPLTPHVNANDREGMCHQLANIGHIDWCKP